MADILLQTKLFIPPLRPSLVPRPRLIPKLNEGLSIKLTLICAPAGFGKTTLLSEWLQQMDLPVAWLSLDQNDNEPIRFLSYIFAALQTIDPTISRSAQELLQSPQPPPVESLLPSLINDIVALSTEFVLVLDDYHVIASQSIHDSLIFLLDHLPPQMHLFIASRSDPPLHLSRLRARGQMSEVRAEALRFTNAETATFLNAVAGLSLTEEHIAALGDRTEGWAAVTVGGTFYAGHDQCLPIHCHIYG
ncbi:NACHT domain-containing protein [Chloroflexi bacterium TSY]|nr:NACHT domain-containing protein [Chloroflexi bacterium TSY]